MSGEPRKPVAASFDAVVDLWPPRDIPEIAYAIVKRTYDVSGAAARLGAPEPLVHDLRDRDTPHRLRPGSDFVLGKRETDVVVTGSAWNRRPTAERVVSVAVGEAVRSIRVFGKRVLEWQGKRPRVPAAEPFEEMPLVLANAYGGGDGRVPLPQTPASAIEKARAAFDHPGLYPRNPFGKGYVVIPEPLDGVELPNLEDPDDPLTDARVVAGDPRRWVFQPLPVCFDWWYPTMFQRYVAAGMEPWHPLEGDAPLPEVQRGLLPAQWRARYADAGAFTGPHADFHQEACPGLRFADLRAGTPIVLRGMHPERDAIAFALPEPPRMEIVLEGHTHAPRPLLSSLVIRPMDAIASATYVVMTDALHRAFVPRIHTKIPLAVRVDGEVVAWEARE